MKNDWYTVLMYVKKNTRHENLSMISAKIERTALS